MSFAEKGFPREIIKARQRLTSATGLGLAGAITTGAALYWALSGGSGEQPSSQATLFSHPVITTPAALESKQSDLPGPKLTDSIGLELEEAVSSFNTSFDKAFESALPVADFAPYESGSFKFDGQISFPIDNGARVFVVRQHQTAEETSRIITIEQYPGAIERSDIPGYIESRTISTYFFVDGQAPYVYEKVSGITKDRKEEVYDKNQSVLTADEIDKLRILIVNGIQQEKINRTPKHQNPI